MPPTAPSDPAERLAIWIVAEAETESLPDLSAVESFDVRHFAGVEEAEQAASPHSHPDVILLIAQDNTGSAVRGLRLGFSDAAVVVWSRERDKNQVAQALAAGAQVVSTDTRSAILVPRLRDAVSRQRRSRRRSEDFEQRLRVLERENKRLRELVYAVTLDLDRDLVALLGHLDQVFEHLPADSPIVDLLDLADHHGSRASELTHELSSYTGTRRLVPEPLDLAELIDEAQVLIRACLPPGQELVLNPGLNLPLVEADRGAVCRLAVDLVLAGSRAPQVEPAGTVTLSTGARHCDRELLQEILGGDGMRTGTFVYLEVAVDLAGGALPDPRAVDGVECLESSLRGYYGGLRCWQQGGRWVLQALLPAFDRSAEDDIPLARGWHAGGKILLIEPNDMATASVLPTLDRLGFEVQAVDDGAGALKALEAGPEAFVLAILDADATRPAAPDLLDRLIAVRADLPVIVSSGRSEADVMAGTDFKESAGFIRKPFRVVNLRRIFRQVLDLETGMIPIVQPPTESTLPTEPKA